MAKVYDNVPAKTLLDNQWSKQERVILVTEIKTGANVSGKSNAVANLLGNTIFFGSILGNAIAMPGDDSAKYKSASAKNVPDYQVKLSDKLASSLKTKISQPLIAINGPLKYHKEIQIGPKDSVIRTTLQLYFTGIEAKANLEGILHWEVSSNGSKYKEASESIDNFNVKSSGTTAEFKLIIDKYDGFGRVSYRSNEFTEEEWLANNCRLVQEEVGKAIDNLSVQLMQILFKG
jgi:hypothetical protein